jgi:hypothetical protein
MFRFEVWKQSIKSNFKQGYMNNFYTKKQTIKQELKRSNRFKSHIHYLHYVHLFENINHNETELTM